MPMCKQYALLCAPRVRSPPTMCTTFISTSAANFEHGRVKTIASKIANDRNHQAALGRRLPRTQRVEVRLVSPLDTFMKAHLRSPTKCSYTSYVQKLAGRSIWHGTIKLNAPAKPHDLHDQFRQFPNCEIRPCPDIDQCWQLLTAFPNLLLHERHTRIRKIVHIYELALWIARTPNDNAFVPPLLCFVRFSNQSRQHMTR